MEMEKAMPIPNEMKEKFTYRDYCQWPDEERWEIIDGIAYDMSPAPSVRHQTILINLSTILKLALKGKPCVPGAAPTDIVLSETDVFQPDLFIVCDRSKITEKKHSGGARRGVRNHQSPHFQKRPVGKARVV